jgi:hypothetical protein
VKNQILIKTSSFQKKIIGTTKNNIKFDSAHEESKLKECHDYEESIQMDQNNCKKNWVRSLSIYKIP